MSGGSSLGVGGSQGFGASTPLGASSNAMGASANGGAGMETLQSFPQLSISELLSVLSEMGTPATSEELSKPTPEFAAKVFGAFLESLNGVTGKWIERQRDAICGQLEYRVSGS
ncbi:hypothetical protein IE81DRAFT_350688 [Ceraceosorus guamensis]|uniref:Kinetochore protein Nuf2 N-terminal domain-containing protein n=1 Tax=Ceraceosorus guamensis TaxID=1522189 RepID=A0A316VMS6_9BASI|nr:hypothetical protein IE81DRAFT_350688 [Ceraceosorus guamensis]PWN38857.1 hypothetical protein IE81DRAFT_350688 [Ceraceosorus guamensis]